MKMMFCEFVTFLILITISVSQSSGVFYKVDNLKLTDPNEQVIQEDTIKCAREGSCQNVYRALQSNVNQPADENTKLSLHFEKMSPEQDHGHYTSCTEVLNSKWKRGSEYRIRRHGMANFVFAECNVVGNEITVLLHHDTEDQVTVNGFESPRSYRKPITYTNSLDDVKSFVDSSASCRQFVRIDCRNMRLFDGKTQYGCLIDRDKNIMTYFGDGPPDGKGCRCGIDSSCATSGKLCNCDKNDYTWRFDEGYINDKQRLPLTEVRLGDTGNSGEYGKFIIGPLECTEP